MKGVISRVVLFALLGFLVVSFGCGSKELTRSKAKKIINEYNLDAYYEGFTGRWHCDQETAKKLKALADAGMIKITATEPDERDKERTIYNYELTEEGEKYLYRYMIIIGKQKVKKVTGIRIEEGGTSAIVTYEYEVKDKTPFFNASMHADPKVILYYVARLLLYDDGWRYKEGWKWTKSDM